MFIDFTKTAAKNMNLKELQSYHEEYLSCCLYHFHSLKVSPSPVFLWCVFFILFFTTWTTSTCDNKPCMWHWNNHLFLIHPLWFHPSLHNREMRVIIPMDWSKIYTFVSGGVPKSSSWSRDHKSMFITKITQEVNIFIYACYSMHCFKHYYLYIF